MKEKKKRPPFNVNATIRGAIRRTFARCPAALEVKNAGRREVPKYKKNGSLAKKPAVQYSCQICLNWVGSTKISVDHIEPVISVTEGFKDWNTFVERMGFDKPENLQRVCDDCHQVKTNGERFARNLKKDQELLLELEATEDLARIKNDLRKFTKKKLADYPHDMVVRIMRLKSLTGRKA